MYVTACILIYAIRILQSLGRGAFMAKTDLKSAFRLIPIHPDDWNLLGIYWQSQYYVDINDYYYFIEHITGDIRSGGNHINIE